MEKLKKPQLHCRLQGGFLVLLGLIINPIGFEIYLDSNWRLQSFPAFLAIIGLEITLILVGFLIIRQGNKTEFSPKRLKRVLWTSRGIGIFIALFICLEIFTRTFSPNPDRYQFSFLQEDDVLGWRPIPNDTIYIPVKGKRARIPLNENGFRGKIYPEVLPSLSVFGDEMVFGWPVSTRSLFTESLNRERKRTGILINNYGVPGYNLLQTYLLMKEMCQKEKSELFVIIINYLNDFQLSTDDEIYYYFNKPIANIEEKQINLRKPTWSGKEKMRKYLIFNFPEIQFLNFFSQRHKSGLTNEDFVSEIDFYASIGEKNDTLILALEEVILRELNKEINQNNKRLVVCSLPTPIQISNYSTRKEIGQLNRYFKRLSSKYKFSYFDLGPSFFKENVKGTACFQNEDNSLTDAGQKVLERAMHSIQTQMNAPLSPGQWQRNFILEDSTSIFR